MELTIKRGDIYYAELNPVIGSEQGGTRPVLIISNDIGNKHSPTVIIAPITSRIHTKAKLPTHTLIKDFDGLDSLAKSNAVAAAQAMWQGIKPERTAADIRRGAAMKPQSTAALIPTKRETKSAVRACLSAMRMRPTSCIS